MVASYPSQALNTFIDDIFAFVIKMPTMYRIGCFRYHFHDIAAIKSLVVTGDQ